jgi:hypothetical protein
MDARCTGDTCSELKTQTADVGMNCTTPQVVKDDINGCKLYSLCIRTSSKLKLANYVTGLTTLPGMVM